MDIQGIIDLLIANEITEVEKHAAKIPFSKMHRFQFNGLIDDYIAGLSATENAKWFTRMYLLLARYESKFGNYNSDPLNRWHHLDMNDLKNKFQILCDERNFKIKVLFFENNTEAMSHRIHEILYSCYLVNNDKTNISSPKGNMNDDVIDLTDKSSLQYKWTLFMKKNFELNVPFDQIQDEFKKKGLHKQTHFVIQSFDKFFFENFQFYYDFWTALNPEKDLFLFIHVPEESLPKDLQAINYLVYHNDKYKDVDRLDFVRFFSKYKCYQEDSSLCKCENMTFHDAIEKLQFRE